MMKLLKHYAWVQVNPLLEFLTIFFDPLQSWPAGPAA